MCLTQLRERETTFNKRLHESESELKALRGGGEKRVAEVEAQRAREVCDTHRRRL